MSELQIVRAKGGHLIHRKVPGVNAALCGFEPRTVREGARCMRIRAGWWIYKKAPTFGEGFDMSCRKCLAAVKAA